jgi:ATP-binding protein involved in chromosome partitioning
MGLFDKIELPDVRHKIVVSSGKGGVGKSMVSSNLAVALARKGLKVALVDADIYGPSAPKMFGIEDERPAVAEAGEKPLMYPVEKYGVKIMSIGFMVAQDKGLIWRGPMASSALKQLFESTLWGTIDYMIIDFPPGTGDIQLTTVQKLNLTGAIIVTTPQEVAVNDARKAASMFSNRGLNVPILGIIENMSWFTPLPHPDEKYYIFGKGGGKKLAEETGSKLLGQIPIIMDIGEAAEQGKSIFDPAVEQATAIFDELVTTILKEVHEALP